MPTTTITSLRELADALRNSPQGNDYEGVGAKYAEQFGLPVAFGEIDWTSLPTFGGDEPASTSGVWSWDATSLLVGTCADDLKIVARDSE
jgi:CTP:molybdopterin cytidylyltransferase MocA